MWVSEEENEWVPDCLGSPVSESLEAEKMASENACFGKGEESMGGSKSVAPVFEVAGDSSNESIHGIEEAVFKSKDNSKVEGVVNSSRDIGGGGVKFHGNNKGKKSCGAKLNHRGKDNSRPLCWALLWVLGPENGFVHK
ncbi:hypothetical protein Hanom_Chr05g00445281 [Helianthus anomalus]